MDTQQNQNPQPKPQTGFFTKLIRRIFIFGILIFAGWFAFYFYFPVTDEGVKDGQLNKIEHKGIVFKTYEGKVIQTGFKAGSAGAIQSNEFYFSVEDKDLAEKLMSLSGQNVILHYKEYKGALPWRGYTSCIVYAVDTAPAAQ